ncbi:MAG TPA: hypothetical protein VF132_05060 [Rudaea sp.]
MAKQSIQSIQTALRRAPALVSGSVASLMSTAMLVALGMRRGRPASGVNGPSQWLYGRAAKYRARADLRHTLAGYAIHHASSLLWSGIFESAAARRRLSNPYARAAVVSALAALVDYAVVPRRLTPGFEAHFRARQIVFVYLAFAGGLAIGSRLLHLSASGLPARRSAGRRRVR